MGIWLDGIAVSTMTVDRMVDEDRDGEETLGQESEEDGPGPP